MHSHGGPWERGWIGVRLRDDAPPGEFSKPLRILVDDPAAPENWVLLSARVTPPVVAEPAVVDLGFVRPRQTAQATVRLRSPQGAEVRVTEIHNPLAAWLRCEQAASERPGEAAVSLATVAVPAGDGFVKDDLTFSVLAGQTDWELRIPVYARIPLQRLSELDQAR